MVEGLTKKQLRELKKLEKMQSKNMEQKGSIVKWIAIAIVGAIFLAIFVGVILVAKDKNGPTESDGAVTIADNGHVRTAGSSDPSNPSTASADQIAENVVTLVEYADFQCPACKSYHPLVIDLLSSYPDQLRLVFKHFPLISIHPNAMDAAIAVEAAGRQGKFFEYADHLYLVQSDWASVPNPQEKFEGYATTLGLDIEKFRQDQKDPAIQEVIEEHRSEGINNGVSGTPSFFVNGERIKNPSSIEEFKAIIDEKLGVSAPDASEQEAPKESTDNLQLQLQE